MGEAYLSIHFEPLTPIFFGPRQELSSSEYVKSAIFPSSYALGGASLRVISEICQLTFQDIEELVEREDIQVRGPYMVAQFGGNFRYFVPAPFDKVHGIILESGEVGEKKPKLMYERSDGLPIPRIARFGRRGAKPEGLLLAEIEFKDAELGWNVNPDSIAVLKEVASERTSFEMNRDKKVVQHGTLYFRSMIESYTLNSNRYGIASKIAFGCDVRLPGDLFRKIDVRGFGDVKLRFGGEGGVAKATVKKGDVPLVKAFQLKHEPKAEKTLLAVSHIALSKVDGKIYALGLGEVEWVLGKIELIGGWLIREKRFKKHVPALIPGSLLKIKNEKTLHNVGEWYLKLLSTAIPYYRGY